MRLSAYHIANNQLRTTRILDVKTESPTVKTFTFKDKQCAKAKPGQFLMLWVSGVDEIPLSIMNGRKDETVHVAVKKVGEATSAIHNAKVGEMIGVRGPFGNSFTLRKGKMLMVGGGTGIAPLLFLTKKLHSEKAKVTFVIGAKTSEELLFIDELTRLCSKSNMVAATEDGSYGMKCLATEPVESLLSQRAFDMIYACGPELMLRKVFDLTEAHGMELEASLERLMRCAVGLCGSCVVGKYRVCRDGPVFNSGQLREVKDKFGRLKRDFDGKEITLA